MHSLIDSQLLAAGVLAVMAASLIGIAGFAFFRSGYTLAQAVLLAWNTLMTRILWRARVEGRLDVPRGQGAVLICNHHCPFDPGFIALATDRIMRWMVAKEFCVHWLTGPFLRAFGVVPTTRGGQDTAAIKQIVRYAAEGELVGLFPEGRINDGDRLMLPGRPGVALIALKSRVPVIPCYIKGAPYDGTIFGCLMMPAKVRVRIGRPLDLTPYYGREDDRAVLEELTKRFMREIARLADRPDFEPEVVERPARRTPPRKNGVKTFDG